MTGTPSRKVTEVAVGVVFRADGAVLLADRPAGKAYPGYWEFPGGKIERGESVGVALARELHEELGIDIAGSTPWVTFEYDYPHAYVRLHFERVSAWQGVPHAREGQRLGFYLPKAELPAPLLPAAVPAMRWLRLPDVLELDRWHAGPILGISDLRAAEARPHGEWVGTFAESRVDLERAARLNCDFALLGPVISSDAPQSRPGLGWHAFAELTRGTPLPIFAFGGLAASDLDEARRYGAQGIARSVPAA